MKKAILFIIALVIVGAGVALASVGVQVDTTIYPAATDIRCTSTGGVTCTMSGSTLTLADSYLGAATVTSGTINGATIGASSPSTGAFTTLSATGITSLGSAAQMTVSAAGVIVDSTLYATTQGSGGNRTVCVSADGKIFSSATACP